MKALTSSLPAPRREWAYFFDIDGTLVEIATTPEGVRLDQALVTLISALYLGTGGAVALISGRTIADVDRIFHAVHIPVAGQHGAERRTAGGQVYRHDMPVGRLDRVRHILADAVARHPGLVLEDKGLSLAIHYRQAPRLGGYVHRLLRSAHDHVGDAYSILPGKRVVEVKPAARDKGAAALEFMREQPFRGRTPVFVGDDVTDEHGFAKVNELGGLSVKVGPGRTVARHRLATVRAVHRWLESGGFAG